ncbi:MAG: MafI family immunity protein [Anaerolineales bacterium]
MSREDIQTLCNAALVSVKDVLPPALYQEADAWINQYDEWGIAIEFLIDEIGELDLPLEREPFEALQVAMVAMGKGESDRVAWLRAYMVDRME